MLYHLISSPVHYFGGALTLKALVAFFITTLSSILFGSRFISAIKKKFVTRVSDRPPKRHLEKNDTPNMGGLYILIITLTYILLWCDKADIRTWLFIACLVSFGIIGFIDDWAKVKHVKGMTAKMKFSLQFVCSGALIGLWYFLCSPHTQLAVPFLKNFSIDIGALLIPWGMFIMIGSSNAVNLTDGLDGLATGTLIFNFLTLSLIAYLSGGNLHSEIIMIGSILCGALVGFLWYNSYPAHIFMGDVGSLSLGAGLAFMALMMRQEVLLMLTGGIFVTETVSVILQIASFKLRGKRIFKMAPIHHHFELAGWNEVKITNRFWIITVLLCVAALSTFIIG